MDNSNIIISVIIVLCIAAGVTAYGVSEGDNAVFNDLTGFSTDSSSSQDTGLEQTTANDADSTGSDTGSGSSSSGTSSSNGGSGHRNNAGSGTGSNTVTGSSGSVSGNGNDNSNNQVSKISSSQAKSIAAGYIGEEGAYVGSVEDSGSAYNCYIYDSSGNWVDTIVISYSGANLGRG